LPSFPGVYTPLPTGLAKEDSATAKSAGISGIVPLPVQEAKASNKTESFIGINIKMRDIIGLRIIINSKSNPASIAFHHWG
jgi:hypothetical protein